MSRRSRKWSASRSRPTGARIVRQRYPATGAANARVDLFVADLAADKPVQLDLGAERDIYLPRVDWFPDSRGIAVQRQSRDQKTLELLRFDALTGRGRVLLTERSEHWVPLHRELTFLKRTPQFIWASSRDGFQHLYLYANDGKLVRQLTSGEFMVVGDPPEPAIRAVDERARRVYFIANLPSPVERQLYWVSLDAPAQAAARHPGRGLAQRHDVQRRARVRRYIVQHRHAEERHAAPSAGGAVWRVCCPTRSTRRIRMRPTSTNMCAPEFGTIAAADGQTLHYKLLKPRNVAPGKRYPVLIDVYGGPGVQRVQQRVGQPVSPISGAARLRRVRARQSRQRLARHAGSRPRWGCAWAGSRCRISCAASNSCAACRSSMRKRIGIFGWSYGGYMTLMCLMQAPEAFAAGVAGAPVTDWTLYDTHYTERYLSTPRPIAAGYAASNVLDIRGQTARPLLLVHGMADDNVLFANSTALMKKLQDLQKPFDLMTYPGGKHGLIRQNVSGWHAHANIVRFFDREIGAELGDLRDNGRRPWRRFLRGRQPFKA